MRVQSPSSINTYRQCARKYYYVYIEELEQLPSIHTLRGTIAHTVLERFFDWEPGMSKEHAASLMQERIVALFVNEWKAQEAELAKLDMPEHEKRAYFEETLVMLFNWLNHFVQRVQQDAEPSLAVVFRKLTPVREQEYASDALKVHGFIDAIEHVDGKVCIIDYKTSKHAEISSEYRLQLAIYTLLYQEKHGNMPDRVGIYFLKHHPVFMDADESLLELAKQEISMIHRMTTSSDIKNYPQKPGPLCNYCDFFAVCKPRGR